MSSIRMTDDGKAILICGKRCELCDDLKEEKKMFKTTGLWNWWRL